MTTQTLPAKFTELEEMLNAELVERRHEIRSMLTALVSGTHIFLLGPPGVAKSLLLNRLIAYIRDESVGDDEQSQMLFQILMTRFTTPDEVMGPVSITALKNDRFERKTEGYLPTARLAFLDEVWKANSSILNALLMAMNERQYVQGNSIIDIPLSTMLCASNELPQDDTLSALYDRIMIRHVVAPVRDAASFTKMLRTTRPANPDPILTWQEVETSKTEAREVIVPDLVITALTDLRHTLKQEAGLEPSERRFVESLRIIRAAAWLDGEDTADVLHMMPLQHCFWNTPDQKAQVQEIVLGISNPLDKEAKVLLDECTKLEETIEGAIKSDEKHRAGAEIHSKIKKANTDLADLRERHGKNKRPTETMEEVRDRLTNITERCLIEIFAMKPAQVAEAKAKMEKEVAGDK